jgi:GntR family transcriptional regulator, transcriptional repressor for pyruvate dehydrogenase complex
MGLLRPGDQLPPEARLAEELGISPVTLRSALTILRGAGLLETRRGRIGGTFVSEGAIDAAPLENGDIPGGAEIRDLVDYRVVVEGGAAALAAERAAPEQLAELARLAAAMEAGTEFEPWSAHDTLFHLIIADASGSPRLVTQVAEIRGEVYRISRHLPTPRPVTELSDREHRELLDAITARQPDLAREAMVRHVESTRALWLGLGRAPRAGSRRPSG